jgi:hypothetical protein
MRLAKAEEFQQRLAEARDRGQERRANEMSARLAAKGINTEPRKEDGTYDFDRAQGLLAKATFQSWDDDKRLERDAKSLARDTKRELRYWEQAQDGRFGVGAQKEAFASRDRIAQLRADVEAGDNQRGTLSEPSGWRALAERNLSNDAKKATAVDNLVKAANAKTMSYQDLAKSFGTTIEKIEEYLKDGVLSPEELEEVFGAQAS